MQFQEAIQTCLNKLTDFTGRAGREEFWYFWLAAFAVNCVCTIISSIVPVFSYVQLVVSFLIFFCLLAVSARRMHDSNHSGWNYLWAFTIIGVVYVIYLWAIEGDKTANKYGEPVTGVKLDNMN